MTKYTWDERERLISEYNSSGMTAKAWCLEKGVAYSTFVGWLHLMKDTRNPADDNKKQREPEQTAPHSPAKTANKLDSPVVWAEVTDIVKTETLEKPDKSVMASDPVGQGQIYLSCGGWTLKIESGFDSALLAEVIRVVNHVCC